MLRLGALVFDYLQRIGPAVMGHDNSGVSHDTLPPENPGMAAKDEGVRGELVL
jgi:hypothetical protein